MHQIVLFLCFLRAPNRVFFFTFLRAPNRVFLWFSSCTKSCFFAVFFVHQMVPYFVPLLQRLGKTQYKQGSKTHIRGWSSLIFIGVNIPAILSWRWDEQRVHWFHPLLMRQGRAIPKGFIAAEAKVAVQTWGGFHADKLCHDATMPTDTEQNSPNKKMVDGFAKSKPAQTSMLVKPHV